MKKILGVLMVLMLLVSCSKDSGDDVLDNFIEINGLKYQVDVFELTHNHLSVGSVKGKTNAISLYKSSFAPTYDRKVSIKSENLDMLSVNDNDFVFKYESLSSVSDDSYYYIKELGDGSYNVEVYFKSPEYTVKAKYVGKLLPW